MAVPRNRMSNARKNSKRAHHAKTPKNFSVCTNCSKAVRSHCACDFCGFYKGKSIITQAKD